MSDQPQLHVGERVITPLGTGTITTITAGHADTDIARYRIDHAGHHAWYYLDELCIVDEHLHTEQ